MRSGFPVARSGWSDSVAQSLVNTYATLSGIDSVVCFRLPATRSNRITPASELDSLMIVLSDNPQSSPS
jgi:hypothetical protein